MDWKKISAIGAGLITLFTLIGFVYQGYAFIRSFEETQKETFAMKRDVTTMFLSRQLSDATDEAKECDLAKAAGDLPVWREETCKDWKKRVDKYSGQLNCALGIEKCDT